MCSHFKYLTFMLQDQLSTKLGNPINKIFQQPIMCIIQKKSGCNNSLSSTYSNKKYIF